MKHLSTLQKMVNFESVAFFFLDTVDLQVNPILNPQGGPCSVLRLSLRKQSSPVTNHPNSFSDYAPPTTVLSSIRRSISPQPHALSNIIFFHSPISPFIITEMGLCTGLRTGCVKILCRQSIGFREVMENQREKSMKQHARNMGL